MCPQCKQPVSAVRIEYIQLYESDGGTLRGVKYSCQSCGLVLSIGIDPFAQKDEIVNELLAKLAQLGKR